MYAFRAAICAAAIFLSLIATAQAQSFNAVFVFGDSEVDAGWWKGAFAGTPNCDGVAQPCTPTTSGSTKEDNVIRDSLNDHATGTPAGARSLMNSQILASYFGLSANPVNSPGGTDYAISGSVDSSCGSSCSGPGGGSGNLNSNPNLPSTTTQISNYLAEHGSRADSSALYYFSSGSNDLNCVQDVNCFANSGNITAEKSFLSSEASALATSIVDLKTAGARYFVFDSAGMGGGLSQYYTEALWSDLAADKVNFVPANVIDMVSFVEAHPQEFGFTPATVMPGVKGALGQPSTGSACVWVTVAGGPNSGWGQWCGTTVNASPGDSNEAYLASADAEQKYFFSDDGHFSAAGQKIEADYVYSLITAPSEISFLAEDAVKSRSSLINDIQTELDFGKQSFGPSGFNAWVIGDVSHLELDNSQSGFPNDPGTPVLVTAGLSYKVSQDVLVGTAVSSGTERSGFSSGGNFDQTEVVGSVYAAYNDGDVWSNIIGSYGGTHYDVNRAVPIGISIQNNVGNTDGSDWSVASQAGYNFHIGALMHGPLIGLLWQRDEVDGYTESGSFTSLGFEGQHRDSAIGSVGYMASIRAGLFQPFAELGWNHEYADTGRSVTAFLAASSIVAPSYSMPAVILGKDWGQGEIGTTIDLAPGVSALAAFTGEFAQGSATTYGGQFGLNVAF